MEATGTRTWRRPGLQLPELAGRLPAALLSGARNLHGVGRKESR